MGPHHLGIMWWFYGSYLPALSLYPLPPSSLLSFAVSLSTLDVFVHLVGECVTTETCLLCCSEARIRTRRQMSQKCGDELTGWLAGLRVSGKVATGKGKCEWSHENLYVCGLGDIASFYGGTICFLRVPPPMVHSIITASAFADGGYFRG